MEIAKINYTVGQIVFGKIKGYPPWPAVVTELPKGKNVAKILYFNSGQYSVLSFKKLTPYHAAGFIVERHLDKNRGFTKAYREMEIVAMQSRKEKRANENNTDKNELNKTAQKKKNIYKTPKVIIKLLSKDEILKIQNDLAKKKKRDISGRSY